MKSAIVAMLKFNGIILFIFLAIVLYVEQSGIRPPSIKLTGLAVLLLAACVIGNIKIVIGKRNEIITSIKNGAIEAAAATIEFKETANLRAQERIKEKNNKD
ncbi:hypothetical protein [Ectopseudomonas oleovorans]|uniref:hypothetical protein n=1 Tax=Ectopseudomonas oleovorans TaxID=301 RepID=UPI001113CC0D|nr:hypothetical protein [Pseudomonas oleovorans]